MSSESPSKKRARGEDGEGNSGTVSALEQLGSITVVVADTGEFQSIKKYKPTDATTNPSLLLKASVLPEYQSLVNDAIDYAMSYPEGERLDIAMDKLAVNFGVEISKIVPGYVSTEVDARLSFDKDATIAR